MKESIFAFIVGICGRALLYPLIINVSILVKFVAVLFSKFGTITTSARESISLSSRFMGMLTV